MDHIPSVLYDSKGDVWYLKDFDPKTKWSLMYFRDRDPVGLWIAPLHVETEFTRKLRPEPKSKIVVQDKWSCAASALAMVLKEDVFFVKQAMGKMGWCNDNRGANDDVCIGAARMFGKDLIRISRKEIAGDIGPAIITLASLNYPKMMHGVAWNGQEILDPNYGRPGRKFWGPEWAPWTIGAQSALVLLNERLSDYDRKEIDVWTKRREKDNINEVRAQVLRQLNEHRGTP